MGTSTLPKDLGGTLDVRILLWTSGLNGRTDQRGMKEHERRWNFRMVPGHVVVNEVLQKKEFWKYKPRKAAGPHGWPYELIAVLQAGASSRDAMHNLLRAIWTFATLPTVTRMTRITTMLKPTKVGNRPRLQAALSLQYCQKNWGEAVCQGYADRVLHCRSAGRLP